MDIEKELEKWYEELKEFPVENHLLCPRTSEDDDENYKTLDDPDSKISVEEKKERIEQGQRRIEVTYWNSLIFGFDKSIAGQWLEDFTKRLEECLRLCSDCVLNWHMKRRARLQKFAEYVSQCATSERCVMLTSAGGGMKKPSSRSRYCLTDWI
jgi:senataxin